MATGFAKHVTELNGTLRSEQRYNFGIMPNRYAVAGDSLKILQSVT
jgi:hypothetical protein